MKGLSTGVVILVLARGVFSAPSIYPTGTTIYRPDKAWNGYTLFDTPNEQGAVLIDMNGTLVRRWKEVAAVPGPARLLPGGDEIGGRLLEDDRLIEVSWDGKILWEWLASDHVDSFGFSEQARNAIHRFPNWTEARGSGDWLHVNAAAYVGPNKWFDAGDRRFHPDNIIISSRNTSVVAIIDRTTGAFVWRMGPDYRESPALRALGQILGQHHPHLIPKGLPGAGNLLVFDNGGASTYGDGNPVAPNGTNVLARINSRVLEIN